MSETENTKAVFLTQADGQKIFLDLNVSTDTTAIKSFEKGAELSIASFDYATGIAVFLALCATGLAYWYGKKSFRLTEMSFNIVSQDIRETALTNTNTATSMMDNQIKITELQIRSKEKCDDFERNLTRGGEIIILQNKFVIELYKLAALNNEIVQQNINIIVRELNDLNKEILSAFYLFLLLMDTSSREYIRIKILVDIFLKISWIVGFRLQLNENIGSIYLDKELKEILYNYFEENSIFDESEVNYIKKIINEEVYDLLSDMSDIVREEIHQYLLNKKAT